MRSCAPCSRVSSPIPMQPLTYATPSRLVYLGILVILRSQAAGRMFWFTWKTLPGSYSALIAASLA